VNRHLEVEVLESERYEVTIAEGSVVTRHWLEVPSDTLDDLGLEEVDGETVVREAFGILLEHEALTAVPAEATLDQIGDHYPYLLPELQDRLAAGGQVRVLPPGGSPDGPARA
jgi:hypothetical protein